MKLLFEDDNGRQSEIVLSTISVKDMNPGDVVVAYYDVGGATPQQSEAVLVKLNEMLKQVFVTAKVLTLATRNGAKDIDISVVAEKKVKNDHDRKSPYTPEKVPRK